MNPLFNALNTAPIVNNSQSLMQAYQIFKSKGNPLNVFRQMALKNPQWQPILKTIESGGNPELIARQMMAQRGINADEFIRQMTSFNR